MSKGNDKELNIVNIVVNMAKDKFVNKMTPKTFSIIKTVENVFKL